MVSHHQVDSYRESGNKYKEQEVSFKEQIIQAIDKATGKLRSPFFAVATEIYRKRGNALTREVLNWLQLLFLDIGNVSSEAEVM